MVLQFVVRLLDAGTRCRKADSIILVLYAKVGIVRRRASTCPGARKSRRDLSLPVRMATAAAQVFPDRRNTICLTNLASLRSRPANTFRHASPLNATFDRMAAARSSIHTTATSQVFPEGRDNGMGYLRNAASCSSFFAEPIELPKKN